LYQLEEVLTIWQYTPGIQIHPFDMILMYFSICSSHAIMINLGWDIEKPAFAVVWKVLFS